MGVVVAAKHLQLEQQVAIKFVLPHAVGDAEAMERFAREARAAVKLRSEHVARVLDVGTLPGGAPYMVMEYLAGRDLGDMIETTGPLSPTDAVDFVLQACEAIAEAHANGIVHRDLKPRNLFVTHAVDGKPLVKVLDFGISKQTALGSSQKELSLTRTASVMGSPNYMSPEQLRSSKSVDSRTDIWALGVILFEVLTTRVPFEAETVTQLTAMVLQDTPRPVNELRADVPRGLAAVIARCLEKDPAMRFATVADLAHALEPFGSTRGVALRISQVTGAAPARCRTLARRSSGRVAVTGGRVWLGGRRSSRRREATRGDRRGRRPWSSSWLVVGVARRSVGRAEASASARHLAGRSHADGSADRARRAGSVCASRRGSRRLVLTGRSCGALAARDVAVAASRPRAPPRPRSASRPRRLRGQAAVAPSSARPTAEAAEVAAGTRRPPLRAELIGRFGFPSVRLGTSCRPNVTRRGVEGAVRFEERSDLR